MSGHSKWANIKNKKGKADAARGSIFTKIGREIAVAVKAGGPDPNSNSRLRDVIAKAKQNNMPNDNIQRSIKKASGELGAVNYEEMTYEGYGAAGVAVIVETLTDNRNRTAGEVRHLFDKYGGALGQTGCVSFMFKKKGIIITERQLEEDDMMMLVLDAGAEDFAEEEDSYEIITEPDAFSAVFAALEEAKIATVSAEVTMIPQTWGTLTDESDIKSMNKILDLLDEDDDVQQVYHNWDE